MLTNGRRVSRRLCGQGWDRAVMPRCESKLLKPPSPRSRASWSRKNRGDRAASRRERTTGTGPIPASVARFLLAELPCPQSTCVNPTPAARNYFQHFLEKFFVAVEQGLM